MSKMNKKLVKGRLIKRITITAVFIAFACVTSLIAGFRLPLFGGDGMHVNLSGIFSSFPAILFGPFYGGATSVFMDLFGSLVKPSGAYNPLFTLTAFCTGFLRGFIWWLVLKLKDSRKFRTTAVCILALFGILGCMNHIFLNKDGVMSGYLATTQTVATKGEVERIKAEKGLSVFSSITVALCSNDTLDLSDCVGAETVVVPSKADYDGYAFSVTKIRSGVFKNKGINTVVLPSTIKKIASDAFDEGTTVIIQDEEKNKNVKTALNKIEGIKIEVVPKDVYQTYQNNESVQMQFVSDEAFRNDLSLYASGLTIGLEGVFVIGIFIALTDFVLSRRRRLAGKPSVSFIGLYVAITGAGLIGSTINTIWLNLFYYSSKAFWVLFIPRTIQEIIISTVQVCIIAVLYDVFLTKIMPRMRGNNLIMQSNLVE